jgi:hypothetical protein
VGSLKALLFPQGYAGTGEGATSFRHGRDSGSRKDAQVAKDFWQVSEQEQQRSGSGDVGNTLKVGRVTRQ